MKVIKVYTAKELTERLKSAEKELTEMRIVAIREGESIKRKNNEVKHYLNRSRTFEKLLEIAESKNKEQKENYEEKIRNLKRYAIVISDIAFGLLIALVWRWFYA